MPFEFLCRWQIDRNSYVCTFTKLYRKEWWVVSPSQDTNLVADAAPADAAPADAAPSNVKPEIGIREVIIASVMAGVIAFAMIVVMTCLGGLINGFVLLKLWGWFVVPTFGVKPLTLTQALGISLLIGFLTFHELPNREKERSLNDLMGSIFLHYIYQFSALSLGWVYHLFMWKGVRLSLHGDSPWGCFENVF